MNACQGFNPQGVQLFATRKKLNDRYVHPNHNAAADGFDVWWQKTFALHTAVVAQASALMRAHRRVNSAGEARTGHSH
jgi:hypothetical protein